VTQGVSVSGPQVLVVEDDREARESVQEVLEWAGYETVVAPDGRAALDLLQTVPAPTLILLDVMMPVMSGPEFMAIRAHDPRLIAIPVVLLTAVAELSELLSEPVLRKPVDLEDLLATVRRYAGSPARQGALWLR
jgi:CheY-like chemotaxis protein